MNEQQIIWLYKQIKGLFQSIAGKPISDQLCREVMDAVSRIEDLTQKSRSENETINSEILCVLSFVLATVHSAEITGNTL